jgi:hypothetical protein
MQHQENAPESKVADTGNSSPTGVSRHGHVRKSSGLTIVRKGHARSDSSATARKVDISVKPSSSPVDADDEGGYSHGALAYDRD